MRVFSVDSNWTVLKCLHLPRYVDPIFSSTRTSRVLPIYFSSFFCVISFMRLLRSCHLLAF